MEALDVPVLAPVTNAVFISLRCVYGGQLQVEKDAITC